MKRILILAIPLMLCALSQGCSSRAAEPGGDVLADAELLAFVDDNGNGSSADDPPRTVHFSDFFERNRPGTRLIMINAAAGWCGPCMHEAGELNKLAGTYGPRGVAVLTAVFQKGDASPADETFTKLWAETFSLSIPALVDSNFVTGKYFDANSLPENMFVDAVSGKILLIATGAKPGDDPLVEYRAWLDNQLQK